MIFILCWSLIHAVVSISRPTKGVISSNAGPYFSEPGPKTVTVSEGSVAYLPCVVEQLGNETVSWIRRRDLHILAIDTIIYTTDDRFSVEFYSENNTWTLVMQSVQERDAGVYECQISTSPVVSIVVLEVLLPIPSVSPPTNNVISSDPGPYFSQPAPTTIAVSEGSVAYLPCVVEHLGNETVSWIRRKDLYILAIDTIIYTTDDRFSVEFSSENNTWTLVMQSVQERDAGVYECQISTSPVVSIVVLEVLLRKPKPTLSLGFFLDAENINEGDDVFFECLVQGENLPQYNISWYQDGNLLTEQFDRLIISEDKLFVPRVERSHSGNYTCEVYYNKGHRISNPVLLTIKFSNETDESSDCLFSQQKKLLGNQSQQPQESNTITLEAHHLIPQADLLHKQHSIIIELFRNLLDKRKQKFNRMMARTYGLVFTENSTIYESIYESVSEIFDKGDKNMEAVIGHFFKGMFRNLFVLVNSQYQFDEGYLECTSNAYEVLNPFGILVEKVTTVIRTNVSPFRAYVQSLSTAASIIRNISKVDHQRSCKAKLNNTDLYIHELCLDEHLPRLKMIWQEFVDVMTTLGNEFLSSSTVADMLDMMSSRIADSLSKFRDSLPDINGKIFRECGAPKYLEKRRRRRSDAEENSFVSTVSNEQNSTNVLSLKHMMDKQIELTAQMLNESKQLWAKLESEMCGSNCRSHQECSRMENTFPNPEIREQITNLKFATVALWKAYYQDREEILVDHYPERKDFELSWKLCPDEFTFYRGFCLWLNFSPKTWGEANSICKKENSHLIEFYSTPRHLQFFLEQQDFDDWNYWIGRPDGGLKDNYQRVKMAYPSWFHNEGLVTGNMTEENEEEDCYFLQYNDSTPAISLNCNDLAGFICQWGH